MDRSGFFGYPPSETPSAARRPEADNGRHPEFSFVKVQCFPIPITSITPISSVLQPFFYFFRTRLHDFNCSDSKTAFQSSKEAIQSRPIFFGHSLPLSRLLLSNSVAQLREKPNNRAASAQVMRSDPSLMRSDPSPDFFKLIFLRFFLCFLSSGVKIFCHSLKGAYQYLPRLTG